MVATDAFDRDDPAATEQGYCLREVSISARDSTGYTQFQLRPAMPTGVRFCMEATVVRVLVFMFARVAHLELSHGSTGAVVGQIADDRKPWAAVGAIGERVAVATVPSFEDFLHAFVTRREVG